MMRRIFLALNLPSDIKEELLQYKEKWSDLPARWTLPDNLHITLLFLGNTSEQELQEIQSKVKDIVAKHKQFSLSLEQIVYGPTEAKPRMLWAIGETTESLRNLKEDIAKALDQQQEHSFSLHITLARLREWEFQRVDPEERPHIKEDISVTIPISSVDIMESKLNRSGATYSTFRSFPLFQKLNS